MTVGEVNTRVTELSELHEHDTQDLYALLEDAQDSRTRISQRVAMDSLRVDLLMKDMIAHQETIQIVEDEAYALGTDGRDSSSDGRHETKDRRHAGRVVSTAWAAEESWTARRGCERKTRKRQNQIKTGQKREAWRSREKFKAVAVKGNKEKDKIGTKPDKIKIKQEAWKSPAMGPHETFQYQPMNQNFYNSNSSSFDQSQPPQFPVIHQPPQEMSIQEIKDLKQQYLDEMKRLINSEYRDEIKIDELKGNFNSMSIEINKKEKLLQLEQLANLSTYPSKQPDNSLSMGDEHLDTILATKSDEFIMSSVENLIPIPSESKGIPNNMCVVPFHDNSPSLDVSKDQFEDFSDSNDEFSSTNDDSFSIDNIDYVEASPPDSELVSSEVMEIVIPEVRGIDDDILLTIKDDILREKLLNINLLIAKIEALNVNPTPSSDFMTKSSSTSLKSLLEETNPFDNSLPEFETFCFDVEEISSGNTTTRSDISLPEYEAFYDDHVKEISSGRNFTMDVVEDISPTREPRDPRVHNAFPTHPNL
nr:hypothetical protein [Tanacetum cinerariifolium]